MLCCVSKKAAAGADLEPPLLGLRCGRIVANRVSSSHVNNFEKFTDSQTAKEKVELNHQEGGSCDVMLSDFCLPTFARFYA